MSQDSLTPRGYIDGILLHIDGYSYALVEDGILPIEQTSSSEYFQGHLMVTFGGNQYCLRVKGTLTAPRHFTQARIRSYINEEGRLLQNGLNFLEERLAAHYRALVPPTKLQKNSNESKSQNESQTKGENASGSKEKQQEETKQKVEPTVPQNAPAEPMTLDEVDEILYEAMRSQYVQSSLYKGANRQREKGAIKKWPRTTQFWWMVVDIALAIASPRLLRWAFTFSRKRGEKMGPYAILPDLAHESNPTFLSSFEQAWRNSIPSGFPLMRIANWWLQSSISSSRLPIFYRDEKSIYGLPEKFSSSPERGGFTSTYKEDNILETLKCLVELRGQFDDLDCFFPKKPDLSFVPGSLMLSWPPSAFEFALPNFTRCKLIHLSRQTTELVHYALDSPEKLLFAVNHLYFAPSVFNPVIAALQMFPKDKFASIVLPIVLALAKMAKEGWCQVYTPSKNVSQDKNKTFSKKPILVFEDTIHQYDPSTLRPAPAIFDFETNSASVLAESCVSDILAMTVDAKDCIPYFTAIKAMVAAGANLRTTNLTGQLPYARIAGTPPKTASAKALREWLIQNNAHKPLYDTLKVTKDTNLKNLPVSTPSEQPRTSKDDYSMIDSICSDTLKYSLIKGDIAAAKKALQKGDCLYFIRNRIPQSSACTEMLYEIIRQGRIESLKLLHEHGFPLKDVFLRRYLFGILPLSTNSIVSCVFIKPGENARDIYYRLIVEAWKVGNLEIVQYLTEVVNCCWSSDIAVEIHFQPFWYAIKMDHERMKREEAEKVKTAKAKPFTRLLEPSKDPSSTSLADILANSTPYTTDFGNLDLSSDLLANSAKDYFESRLMASNMGDPGTSMPSSIYAASIGSLEALKWMVSRGWNIFEDKYEGAKILHFAAASGYDEMAEWIVQYDTRAIPDNYGLTAFDWALMMMRQNLNSSFLNYLELSSIRKIHPEFNTVDMNEIQSLDLLEGSFRTAMTLNTGSSISCPFDSIEWADATLGALTLTQSTVFPSMVYSGFDSHDQIAVQCGLNRPRAFTNFKRGDFRKVALSKHIEHLREPIEDYLIYRDTVLPYMDESNHNEKRMTRYAQKNEKFKSRLESGQVFSWSLVSDFAKRISKDDNFEIDFWISWVASGENAEISISQENAFLMLSQFAGRNLLFSEVDMYKRDWLQYEPCADGAVAPLLEMISANPTKDSKIWTQPSFPGRVCRKSNIFVAVARATPCLAEFGGQLIRNEQNQQVFASGWGTSAGANLTARPGRNMENITRPLLVWMFTSLFPHAKRIVALVSEIFVEVVLTGSIPMAEWLIDNCELGNKNMDCYSMMMAQVAITGSLEMLKWLFHRGFPLRFLPKDEGLNLEAVERFTTSSILPKIPQALISDFEERRKSLQSHISLNSANLSARPNFINLVIAHYVVAEASKPKKSPSNAFDLVKLARMMSGNSIGNNHDPKPAMCLKIDFLMRNGVPLFEPETHPEACEWDASHYIAAAGLEFLVDHLKREHNVTMPNRKDTKGRKPEDLRRMALSSGGKK